MRLPFRHLPMAAALWFVALPAPALERAPSRRVNADAHDSWSGSSTETIRYYNICTGWVWLWPFGNEDDRIGVVFDAGFSGALNVTWVLTYSGAPVGWGYTGTIAVHAVDGDDCPVDPPLVSQRYIPPVTNAWTPVAWGGTPVPPRFAVVITSPSPLGMPGSIASDHPGSGPTGPMACGVCYPSTRVTHSYDWGVKTEQRCPGDPLFDGFCNAELMLDASVRGAVSLESDSWGHIKALYR